MRGRAFNLLFKFWLLFTGLFNFQLFLGWFDIDDVHNTNVYVSGLPLDITLEEFAEYMQKCGIIMEDDDGMY